MVSLLPPAEAEINGGSEFKANGMGTARSNTRPKHMEGRPRSQLPSSAACDRGGGMDSHEDSWARGLSKRNVDSISVPGFISPRANWRELGSLLMSMRPSVGRSACPARSAPLSSPTNWHSGPGVIGHGK